MTSLPSILSPNFDFNLIYAGPLYLFSTGTVQWLMVTNTEMVKEIIMYLFGFREVYLFVQRSGSTLGPRYIVIKWANFGLIRGR